MKINASPISKITFVVKYIFTFFCVLCFSKGTVTNPKESPSQPTGAIRNSGETSSSTKKIAWATTQQNEENKDNQGNSITTKIALATKRDEAKTETQGNHAMKINKTAKMGKNSALHKTIKIFISVTILFLVAYIPSVFKMTNLVEDFFPIMYAYFINHFGNPIIYYVMDEMFRKEVNRVVGKLKCR